MLATSRRPVISSSRISELIQAIPDSYLGLQGFEYPIRLVQSIEQPNNLRKQQSKAIDSNPQCQLTTS